MIAEIVSILIGATVVAAIAGCARLFRLDDPEQTWRNRI